MKNKLKLFTIILLTFTSLIIIAPLVAAKTRDSYMINYIYANQGLIEDSEDFFGDNYEENTQALQILDYYNAFSIEGPFGVEHQVDKVDLSNYLEDNLYDMFDSNTLLLYDLYNILQAFVLIGYTIDSALNVTVQKYLNSSSHVSGGFSPINTSISSDLASTFYAYQIYNLLGVEFPNKTIHENWILSCFRIDGGYAGNSTLTSTLLTTYYAVVLISELDSVNALMSKSKTLEYLNSFFINDTYDQIGYGGYLPMELAVFPLLSSTYFAATAIDYIQGNQSSYLHKDATVSWILERQNFQDGGFSDKYSENNQELSSITTTSYAFKTLMLFDSLSSLDQEVFMVEFNYLILTIVLVAIGILIIISYVIWRRRRV